MADPHHYPTWFPYCTSEYTMEACREMRERARAEGYEVRIDNRGTHLAGDGQYHAFGKVFIRSPQAATA